MNSDNGEGPSQPVLSNGSSSDPPIRLSDRMNPGRPAHSVTRRAPSEDPRRDDDDAEEADSDGTERSPSETSENPPSPESPIFSVKPSPFRAALLALEPLDSDEPISPNPRDAQPSTSSSSDLPPHLTSAAPSAPGAHSSSDPDALHESRSMAPDEDDNETMTDYELSQTSSISPSPVSPLQPPDYTNFQSTSSVVQPMIPTPSDPCYDPENATMRIEYTFDPPGTESKHNSPDTPAPTTSDSTTPPGRPTSRPLAKYTPSEDRERIRKLLIYDQKIEKSNEKLDEINEKINELEEEKGGKEGELREMEESYEIKAKTCNEMDEKLREKAAARKAKRCPGNTEPVGLQDYLGEELFAYSSLKLETDDLFDALESLRSELEAVDEEIRNLEEKAAKVLELIDKYEKSAGRLARSVSGSSVLLFEQRRSQGGRTVLEEPDDAMEDPEMNHEEVEDEEDGEIVDDDGPSTSTPAGRRPRRGNRPSTTGSVSFKNVPSVRKQNGNAGTRRQRSTGSTSGEEDQRAKRPAARRSRTSSRSSPTRRGRVIPQSVVCATPRMTRSRVASQQPSPQPSRSQSADAPRTRGRSAGRCANGTSRATSTSRNVDTGTSATRTRGRPRARQSTTSRQPSRSTSRTAGLAATSSKKKPHKRIRSGTGLRAEDYKKRRTSTRRLTSKDANRKAK